MKRLCATICLLVLVLSVLLAIPVSAELAEISPETIRWNSLRPQALYIQNGTNLTSAVNPAYSADLPLYAIPEAGVMATCTVNMRGFALSPDGRYAYMGIQHGGGDIVRGLFVMETMTGRITDFACRYDGDICTSGVPYSYPKGIAADARGYVYVGYTLSASYNTAYLAIYRQNHDGTLTQIADTPVCSLGEAGGPFGTKVGINGVTVRELNGQTYCYIVTNYDHDTLVRFDVTNPENPLLDNAFGHSGTMDLSPRTLPLYGYTLDEGQYLDVTPDGTVYLCFTATDGRDGIAVLTPDGKSCRQVLPQTGAYCVLAIDDILLCGTRTGGQIAVLDRQTGKSHGTLSTLDNYGERITRLQVANDVLFICDAGSLEDTANAIYTAPLSAVGDTYLDAIVTAQNTGTTDWYESDTASTTTPPTEPSTPESTTDLPTPIPPSTTTPTPPPPPPSSCTTHLRSPISSFFFLLSSLFFIFKRYSPCKRSE